MKHFYWKICLLCTLFFAACAEDETSTFGSISGVVKDKMTSEALAGVRVSISPGGTSSVTGTDGSFQFGDLEAADYTISYTKEGYASDSKKVTVAPGSPRDASVMLEPIVPELNVSPTKLDFGSETSTLALDITNTGKGALQWSISEELPWLSCAPASGTTTNESSSVVVSLSREGLERGNYNGTIVISSNGGSVTVSVKAVVENANLSIVPDALDFGSLTSSIQMTLKNTGYGTRTYKAESSKEWLTLSKAQGSVTKTDYLTAIVSREGLSAGKYSATITLSVDGDKIVVPVQMEVSTNSMPTVTAEKVANITSTSAVLHGTVVSVGSAKITRYGFCWSEHPDATIEDSSASLGDCSEPTAFECPVTNLKAETKYYFRAYAENEVGIAYSDKELSFTTNGLPALPVVKSGVVEQITSSSAVAKGSIVSLGNVAKVTRYGHVWSKSAQPTLEKDKYTDLGSNDATGAYTSEITGLEANTTYYVRAYAKNEAGTAYGEELSFTTQMPPVNPTNGLYGYYTFEGNTRNTVDGAPNGQGINKPTYVEGVGGSQALKMSVAADSYFSIPEAMIDSNTFTISFWIKGLSDGHIFHVSCLQGFKDAYVLSMQDGMLTFWSGYGWAHPANKNYSVAFTHPEIDSDAWNMIAITIQARVEWETQVTARLYVNGELMDQGGCRIDGVNKGAKFIFGGKLGNTPPPSMTIDNLRIYKNRTLSDSEIMQIYDYEK